MTGIIDRLAPSRTFCFIKDQTGAEFFAHEKDFVDPSVMTPGRKVSCRLKLAGQLGHPWPVTDVIAA